MTDGTLTSVLLGIIEGVTEFLPVSSTAHLRIAETLMGLSLEDGYWKTYSIAIQLGAILCLPVYFWSRIVGFLKSFVEAKKKLTHPLSLVVIAFIVTAVPSFLLLKQIGKNLEDLHVMAWALIVGGIVMGVIDQDHAAAEKRAAKGSSRVVTTARMEDMTLKQAVVIGAAQVLAAVFPGVSRSMATIAGGQIMGLSRAAALEFSFFLSMPTMAAATGLALLKTMFGHEANPVGATALTGGQWSTLAIGFVVSFIVAYGSVAFLMNWVQKRGFLPFALYRVLAGLAILFFMV
jgi:undecaprenyl-diphosphatase